MYVDESGDPGKHEYASKHFILSGLIIHQNDWANNLNNLKEFRKSMKTRYGLKVGVEIHASELIRINKIEEYKNIKKDNRINILRDFCLNIPIIFNTGKLINICLDKSDFLNTKDIQITAWTRLIQRFDNYLKSKNDKGIIISDNTDGKKISSLIRKMRIYNPLPSKITKQTYNLPINNIIEDVFLRDSDNSYFIQTVDVVSHLLYRKEYTKGSLKKYNLHKQFDILEPILLKEAAKNDSLGIVRK
jgi:hypothetical protein